MLFKCYIFTMSYRTKEVNEEGSKHIPQDTYRPKEANKKGLKLTSPSKQTKSSSKKIKEKVHYTIIVGSIHSHVWAIFDIISDASFST